MSPDLKQALDEAELNWATERLKGMTGPCYECDGLGHQKDGIYSIICKKCHGFKICNRREWRAAADALHKAILAVTNHIEEGEKDE